MPRYRLWLHLLAIALVLATFGLVAIGGTVTSYDAGMAVPDGFTTFGYWSLTAPLEVWWHDFGTRLEHSHRLKGYVVGWLTIGLLVGILVTQRGRGWLKGLAVGLLVFVIAQGVLGILRVDEVSTVLAAIHGITGQLFLCLTVLAAAAVGAVWTRQLRENSEAIRRVPASAWVLLGLLLVQLTLGSAVRHADAGMAIPDWPLHYGQVLPPMDKQTLMVDAGVWHVERGVTQGVVLPEVWQVHLHFAHRLGAYLVTAFTAWFVIHHWRRHRGRGAVIRHLGLLAGVLTLQVLLGIYTVFSEVHPTLATLHQTIGAAVIASATLVAVRLKLFAGLAPAPRRTANTPPVSADSSITPGGVTA